MKKLFWILGLAVLLPQAPSWAQLYPPNEAGVTMGAWHTIVRDIDTTRKWWEIWGGKPLKIDGVDVMKFHGVFVFMVKGEPNGPSRDHFVDHVAFQTPTGFDLMKTLVNAGVKTDKINPETMRGLNWTPGNDERTWSYAYSPDGLRVEIETDEDAVAKNDLAVGTHSDMMHFYLNSLEDLRASYNWYRKNFDGKMIPGSPSIALGIPGARLNFATEKKAPRPINKGGALDYIGFEVKNLDTFVQRLQKDGVKFDQPYSKTRHKGYASAQLTAPWGGLVIELTEGLNKF